MKKIDSAVKISGHADEWVALVDDKVVAASKSFNGLVKKLESEKLLNKATVTHVSGTYVTL